MAPIVDKSFDARMEAVHQMLPVGLASMLGLGLCLFAARALLPVLFPKQMGALPESRRFFVAQCVVSGLHALVSGPVATYVMYQLSFSGEYPTAACPAQPNAGTVPAPPLAVWVTGFTCGYFVYDSMVMAFYSKYCTEEMGGSGTLLMWVHHVISVIVWPYCIASDRAVLFVCFFLFTELSNIGQASRPTHEYTAPPWLPPDSRADHSMSTAYTLHRHSTKPRAPPHRIRRAGPPWAQHRALAAATLDRQTRPRTPAHAFIRPFTPLSPHPHQAASLIVSKGKIAAFAEGLIGGGWAPHKLPASPNPPAHPSPIASPPPCTRLLSSS
jgi:hypothetical protein